jgi:hypothetical protein
VICIDQLWDGETRRHVKSRRDSHEDVDDDPFLSVPARVGQDQQSREDDDHGNTVSDKRRLPECQDQRIRVKLQESTTYEL